MKYSIVGIEHRKAEAFVKAQPAGCDAVLRREPNNPFDPSAVGVWIDGKHVGYIPKNQNVKLARRIDETGEPTLAMDSRVPPDGKAMRAKFVRSPNSNYPMVEVDDERQG